MSAPESGAPPSAERRPSPLIQDRRSEPAGVMPRQLQMWLMAGMALVILVIILFTGRASPRSRGAASPERPVESPLAAAERIRSYRQQLTEEQARQQQLATARPASTPEVA